MSIEIDDLSWGEKFAPSLKLSGAEFYDQFEAVRRFLSSQTEASAESAREMEQRMERISKSTGEERDWLLEDMYLDLFIPDVYDGAARSMASVGMLAPLVESLFKRLARVLKTDWPPRGFPVDTIASMIGAHGINQMPTNWEPVLRALFHFRNNMFHLGFEWPLDERNKFETLIQTSRWPTSWFDRAWQDDQAWIFYLSDEFVSRCLDVVESIMKAVAEFIEIQGVDFFWRAREEVPLRAKS